jgi:hypothetical protein
MAQPIWLTPAGSLGVFPTLRNLSIQVIASPQSPSTSVTYTLLNGALHAGLSFSNGVIQGTPSSVLTPVTSTFTVRAVDNLGNIKDRTFSLTVEQVQSISIVTSAGSILTVSDSTYVDYQIQVNNPTSVDDYALTVSGGDLPPGLQLTERGRITGYANPPVLSNGSPTTLTYNFTVQLTSSVGIDTRSFSITVINQSLFNPLNTRIPAILNTRPLSLPVNPDDQYYAYYNDGTLPTVRANEYFAFKVIGYDFDESPLRYSFSALPPGLIGDSNTGWITGSPIATAVTFNRYNIEVVAFKANNVGIRSTSQTFVLTVTNDVKEDIVWQTPDIVGTLSNGEISQLSVSASSERNIEYRLVAGSLPPNMDLQLDGEITGRVPFQSATSFTITNSTIPFTFTVEAYLPEFPLVSSRKTFTLLVTQTFTKPYENLYFKCTPNFADRSIITSLLTDTTLIPNSALYRPQDKYFGKASDVSFVFQYGVEASGITQYLNAIQQNFYNKQFVLGPLKTAIARDLDNNILYEVVYSEIVDDLINSQGQSVAKEVIWPTVVRLSENDNFTATDELFVTFADLYTSGSQYYTNEFFPSSVPNMQAQLKETLTVSANDSILPEWMTSQQNDGGTLGFIKAWVICYTLPGLSSTVKANIENNWQYRLNQIDFSVDRFNVDKSATYNFDILLSIDAWTSFPSATPEPSPEDQKDLPILFPRKTILPDVPGQ